MGHAGHHALDSTVGAGAAHRARRARHSTESTEREADRAASRDQSRAAPPRRPGSGHPRRQEDRIPNVCSLRTSSEQVQCVPIRLLPTPPTCRMLPGSGVKLCVGRCGDVARDAEQGTEGVERIEPPVEAEGEFVEVGLQVLGTDPVMDAVQPRFQVCEEWPNTTASGCG